jgi:hypothetical protein
MLSYKSMCKLILLHRLMRRCNQPKHLNATRVLFKFISIWDPMQTLMLHKLFWLLSHINITLCMIWYYWTTKFILEIPQFKIYKNKLKLVLEIAKQKTGIKRNEMKRKKKEITYLAAAQPHGPTTRPNQRSQATYHFGRESSSSSRRWKQLGGARSVTRSTAASWTREMKAAAPGRL